MAFNVATSYDSSSCQEEHGYYTKYAIKNSFRAWTSREWLAAMAMQGLCSWGNTHSVDHVVDAAFLIADAMLKYQEKENDL